VTTAGFSLLQLSALKFIPGSGAEEYSGGFVNPPAESASTLKRTVTTAGFSLLQLSALEFIPGSGAEEYSCRLCQSGRSGRDKLR